jgi:hypothetical protein
MNVTKEARVKPIVIAAATLAAALSACSYTETRTVQPAPRTAVVTPAPAVTATTYTTPETTTTVYSR